MVEMNEQLSNKDFKKEMRCKYLAKKEVGTKEHINFLNNNNIPLSPAVKFKDLLLVSGQPPLDLEKNEYIFGDIEAQTEKVMQNLKMILESNGSSLNNILRTTVYATNAGHYDRINKIYAKYLEENKPARTFVTVGSFNEGFDIEIDCIAYVDQK